VLKITRLCRKRPPPVLKLEGEIREPWVTTVRDACARRGRRSRPPGLDLAAVTYVDAAGAQLLRELVGAGIEITACSRYISALLHLEDA
jgi:hypothetical protein